MRFHHSLGSSLVDISDDAIAKSLGSKESFQHGYRDIELIFNFLTDTFTEHTDSHHYSSVIIHLNIKISIYEK